MSSEVLPGFVHLIFFLVATLYSSQGFGGGSSYLAALVLLGFSYRELPAIALVCNLVVTGIAFVRFAGEGHFQFKKVLPFVVLSVPAAYVGGHIALSKETFSILLGAALFFMGIRIAIAEREMYPKDVSMRKRWMVGVPAGGVIGFFSGLIGIGGGIFLSPMLLLIRWANTKECAAAASFFIFVNSATGLAARLPKTPIPWDWALSLATMAAVGGWIGSRAGALKMPRPLMQKVLAALVLFASYKLFEGVL